MAKRIITILLALLGALLAAALAYVAYVMITYERLPDLSLIHIYGRHLWRCHNDYFICRADGKVKAAVNSCRAIHKDIIIRLL